jgi:hypothetical protein
MSATAASHMPMEVSVESILFVAEGLKLVEIKKSCEDTKMSNQNP